MKVQIDNNKYLTGNYCQIGNIDNSIEMESLPKSEPIYYTAYKLLSREEERMTTVMEEVPKQRPITVPILDEDGNETGETEEIMEDYTELEPVEKPVKFTVYYYELDEAKKKEIDDMLENLPSIIENPLTLSDLNDQINDVQNILIELFERMM